MRTLIVAVFAIAFTGTGWAHKQQGAPGVLVSARPQDLGTGHYTMVPVAAWRDVVELKYNRMVHVPAGGGYSLWDVKLKNGSTKQALIPRVQAPDGTELVQGLYDIRHKDNNPFSNELI